MCAAWIDADPAGAFGAPEPGHVVLGARTDSRVRIDSRNLPQRNLGLENPACPSRARQCIRTRCRRRKNTEGRSYSPIRRQIHAPSALPGASLNQLLDARTAPAPASSSVRTQDVLPRSGRTPMARASHIARAPGSRQTLSRRAVSIWALSATTMAVFLRQHAQLIRSGSRSAFVRSVATDGCRQRRCCCVWHRRAGNPRAHRGDFATPAPGWQMRPPVGAPSRAIETARPAAGNPTEAADLLIAKQPTPSKTCQATWRATLPINLAPP